MRPSTLKIMYDLADLSSTPRRGDVASPIILGFEVMGGSKAYSFKKISIGNLDLENKSELFSHRELFSIKLDMNWPQYPPEVLQSFCSILTNQ